jgi:hypothetical protein
MLQQARMPYVRFVTSVAETKDEEGHVVYKNKYFAHITPAGGKDEVVKDAEEWITELKRKGDTRGPFDAAANEYGRWYEHFSKGFDAFKMGEEMLTEGTPLRACMAFTKAEVAQAESVRIFSLEELSQCNEEAIRNMGVGARALKNKATQVLKSNQGNHSAEEMTALRVQVEELQATIEAMKEAGLTVPKKPGRPPKV